MVDAFTEAYELTHKRSKEEHDSLKAQVKTIGERIADPRFSQWRGPSDHRSETKFLTRQKGFQNLKSYNGGTSARWEEWRFGVMTWIQQESPTIARLADKVEKLETEPKEPVDESTRVTLSHVGFGAVDTLTDDEEWDSEQLWALLVAKATGQAYQMIVGLNNAPRSRGVRAWFKLMLDAKGTHQVQVHEVTEKSMPLTESKSRSRTWSPVSRLRTT